MDFENAEDDFEYCGAFTKLEDIESIDSIESIESSTEDVTVTFDATEELLSNI